MTNFIAACVQHNATENIETNLPIVKDLIHLALDQKADFIALPECVSLMEPNQDYLIQKAPEEREHPFLELYENEAKKSKIWLLGGTLAIKSKNNLGHNKIFNRLYLFNPLGKIVAKYDKIHMFDVNLGNGLVYSESETYEAGNRAVVANIPWGKLGLSICYDIRFPNLYRDLAHAGANILCAPAAFTKVTGEAHWHILQRARAIETGSFIISPALCGSHSGGKETYGHSLIIDPWGKILADGGEGPGVISAKIDMNKVNEVRAKIPSLQHDRTFTLETV
ncbi:MAG: carbon-nitrogen hydrolase family protein [Rhodospirillales bacterium]|jgi:predicted amidohydrolase|nr:carbon-nitrogen hydrolase family protein [Rhodospirillales bacterium]